MRSKLEGFLFLLGCALVAGVMTANAATLYSTGFENPPFALGPIAGQDGWNTFGPGLATVQNSFAKSGIQAVFIDGASASQSGPYYSVTTAGPLVELSADIAIFTSSTQSGWQFAGVGPGLSQFLGGINVGSDNTIRAITPGFTAIGSFTRATAFDATAWHRITLLFDITTQTYGVMLDGSSLATGLAFCGSNAGCTGAHVAQFGTAIFDTFGGVGGNDSAYMDNFQVAETAQVPEPSSIALLILGLGVCLRRRLVRD